MKFNHIKKFSMALCLALLSFNLYAYDITGQIVDRTDNSELAGASVVIKTDSVSIVTAVTADEKGRFHVSGITSPDIWVDVQMMGYQGQRTVISGNEGENLNLDVIALTPVQNMLDEVTVTGSSVIQKPDRYLIIPSQKDIERSASSLSLLSTLQMKMPGLYVNEQLQRATIENRTPVFQINGKEVPYSRILTINNNNILRIEYHDTPDIRYADRGAPGIINFVMRPVQEGGSVMASAMGAVTTGFLNANVGATYNYKKSEWAFNYSSSWRNYDEWQSEGSETFIGKDATLTRTSEAIPSKMSYLDNSLSLGYTYMHDLKTMFAATVQANIYGHATNDRYNRITETNGEKYLRHSVSNTESWRPSGDIYFRKQFDKNSKFEVNAFGSISNGNYDGLLNYTYDNGNPEYHQTNRTENTSWRAGAEALYSRNYSSLTTTYGVKYYRNYAENLYSENMESATLDKLNTDYLYAYGSVVGRWKKLGYSAGIGGIYAHTKEQEREMNAFRPKVNVTLNYQLPKNWSLNYLFIFDPTLPSLSQQSETVQTIDDISVRMGNMSLKPSSWFRNRIYVRYTYKKFTGTFWASHSRTIDPMFNRYTYISDMGNPLYGKFLQQTVNGERDDRINLQLNIGFQELLNHFSIYGIAGWDRYDFTGFGKINCDKRFYSSIQAQAYFGNWTIAANFEITPQYTLSGNQLSRSERWNTIQVQYKWRNWYFSCTLSNPFTKDGALYESITLSDVHPESRRTFIPDNANMVSLSATYRLNFGKGLKKYSRTIKNSGLDTGVSGY